MNNIHATNLLIKRNHIVVMRTATIRTRRFASIRCNAISISEMNQQLSAKTLTATDVVKQYIAQAQAAESSVGSFITIDEAGAIQQATSIDQRLQAGEHVGPLAGVPIAVKDNICTQSLRTTAGSKILSQYIPSYDATAVARLRAAGAVIIGKTNMDEFGMGSSTENSAYHITKNPWDANRVPGGSSGGSAAAVAARQCVASLGSDTGGSIRQPAHFCGVVGVKPTYGRVSRYGLISYASSLDCIGPLATSVADAAAVLQAIAGPDSSDATCSRREADDFVSALKHASTFSSTPLQGKKVAVIKETIGAGVDAAVNDTLSAARAHLESLGAVADEVSLPTFATGLPAYYVIALSEASSNLARYDGVRYGERIAGAADMAQMFAGSREQGLGDEVKRRILMGTYALSAGYYDAFYKRAQQVRTLVRQEMSKSLEQYDLLLCPAAPTPAYKVGEKTKDPLAMYKGDLMTVNLNLAGLPAVTLPCGSTVVDGVTLPIGVQMIGRAFGEADMLNIAHIFEQTLNLDIGIPSLAAS